MSKLATPDADRIYATTRKRRATAPPKAGRGSILDAARFVKVAFLTHLDTNTLVVAASDWIEDDTSTAMVPTFGFDSVGNCVQANQHDVSRRNLVYVGAFHGGQCQQQDGHGEWVLARRRT